MKQHGPWFHEIAGEGDRKWLLLGELFDDNDIVRYDVSIYHLNVCMHSMGVQIVYEKSLEPQANDQSNRL